MTGLRVIFMGTPDFAVPALQALSNSSHKVIAVYSQPPRPKGRGQQVQKSPVHEAAEAAGIPVHTPLSFKKDAAAVSQLQALNADIAVVAAYGLILPMSVLEAPKFGCLNIHASLLPRWRGASPIQHAIWKGDARSGVTIMQMNAGLDTGDMISKRDIQITSETTTASLHDDLMMMGGAMVTDILDQLATGKPISHEAQDETLTCYAPLLKKEDGKIDPQAASAADIDRQVRALNPWPGTYVITAEGKRLKVLEGRVGETAPEKAGMILKSGGVVCADGRVYLITRLQPENTKAMDAASAINGKYLTVGSMLL